MSEVVVAGPSSSTESELLIPCGQGDPEDDSLYSDISSTDLPEFPGADSDCLVLRHVHTRLDSWQPVFGFDLA